MRLPRQQSLTHQFFVYMTIIGILPLAIVAGATYYSLSNSFLEREITDQRDFQHSERERIILIQEQVESLIDNISGVELIRSALNKPRTELTNFNRLSTEARVGSILNGYLNIRGIVSIHLFGRHGSRFHVGETLALEAPLDSGTRNILDRARESGRRIYWAGVEENINRRSRSRYVLPAIKILYETDRDTLERVETGVIMVNYSIEYLARPFAERRQNRASVGMLLDQFRRVVAGRQATPLPEPEVLVAPFTDDRSNDIVEAGGETYYRIYTPIERSGWMLVSVTPRESILSGLIQLRNRTLAALALAFAFVIWVSMRFSRSVVSPAADIARSFASLNDRPGEATPLPVHGAGEIAELTKLFNRFINQQVEREHANQALREAATVFSVSPEGIVISDTDGIIRMVNPAFTRITGYTAEEAVGHPVSLLDPELTKDEFRRQIGSPPGDHEYFEREARGRRSNGENFPLWSTVSKVCDESGEVVEYVTMFVDLTEHELAEQEQARLQREVSQSRKLQALGQLTGGIAHDFNNILGIVMGYTSLSLRKYADQVDEKLVGYLNTIMSASERARNLIAQMMTYSRNEPLEVRNMDLAPAVEESVNMLRSIIPSSISVSFSCDDDLPEVAMDAVGLQQIVMNLCVNARDAMDGAGRLGVHLGRRRVDNAECASCHRRIRGEWVELSVTDTGCGIESQVLDHLFEPFFTTKEVGKGVGMGLAVVQGIIQRFGAHVLVDSTPGQGSVVRVLLPPVEGDARSSKAGVEMSTAKTAAVNGGRVLVVDDEPELAEITAESLEVCGYRCTVCSDGRSALDLVTADPAKIDVIVTDQTMPGMTGVELIDRVRRLDPGMPVILTTGYSDAIDADNAGKLGITFMNKPVDPEHLASEVAIAVERRGVDAGQ